VTSFRETEVFDLCARVAGSTLTVSGVSDIEAIKGANIKVKGNSICTFKDKSKGVLMDKSIGIAKQGSTVVALDSSICFVEKGGRAYGHGDSVIITEKGNVTVSENATILTIVHGEEELDIEKIERNQGYLFVDTINETLEHNEFLKNINTTDFILFRRDSTDSDKNVLSVDSQYLRSVKGFYGLMYWANTKEEGYYDIYKIHKSTPLKRITLYKGLHFGIWDASNIQIKFFKSILINSQKTIAMDIF
jgi:hypothetical protein